MKLKFADWLPVRMGSVLCRVILFAMLSVGETRTAMAQLVISQTNYGTGDKSIPGPGNAVSNADLLQTHLASASRTGSSGFGNTYFYRENDGYPVDLGRLTDGSFGPEGTDAASSVLPNNVTITFGLSLADNPGGYTITGIRTYAGWDDGRDGQAYTVEYSTVSAPDTFVSLATVSRFDNTSFPLTRTSYDYDYETGQYTEVEVPDEDYSHTMVELTGSEGYLATDVAAIRFIFNGIENGGTAYREFDVFGSATAVPEPATYAAATGALMMVYSVWRKRRRS